MKKCIQFYPNKEQTEFLVDCLSKSMATIIEGIKNGNSLSKIIFNYKSENFINGYINIEFVINIPHDIDNSNFLEKIANTTIYHTPIIYVQENQEYDFLINFDSRDMLDIEKYI